MTDANQKARQIWAEDTPQADIARSMTGMEQITAMLDGRIPPLAFSHGLGIRLAHAEPGLARMVLTPREDHYNMGGTVHGGVIATTLDSAMGCAMLSVLPRGRRMSTLELKVNYLRPVTAACGPVTAEALVLQAGRRTGVLEAKLRCEAGKLYAIATATFMLFELGHG